MLSNNLTEANSKDICSLRTKIRPPANTFHLKLGTAVATEYHKHVPNVPATALHFSETKENLLQLSITALLSKLKNLEQRQMEILQICHTERQYHYLFFKDSLHCHALSPAKS